MANLEAKTKTKSNSKYTEDWIPIRNISNGMIVLDNKKKVTGVKIRPRNIFILDQGTQDNVLIALKNFYNMIDFEFWLISTPGSNISTFTVPDKLAIDVEPINISSC